MRFYILKTNKNEQQKIQKVTTMGEMRGMLYSGHGILAL